MQQHASFHGGAVTVRAPSTAVSVGAAIGRYRWVICALLFFAATINYIDRQVIGILKSTLQGEFGWTERDYAAIVFTFQLAYAIGLLATGPIMDRLGVRRATRSPSSCGASPRSRTRSRTSSRRRSRRSSSTRRPASLRDAHRRRRRLRARALLLGLGEGGNFPAAIKAIAEWFPKKERAFATGIFNSGTNIGALVTPLVVPWITVNVGLGVGVHLTGLLGFFWVVWWLLRLSARPRSTRRSRRPSSRYIRSDPPSDHAGALGAGRALPPDLGVRDRQVHDRSDLVAVPVLDPGLPQAQSRPRPQIDRPADGRDLPGRRRRQHRRRLAVVAAAEARLVAPTRRARRRC